MIAKAGISPDELQDFGTTLNERGRSPDDFAVSSQESVGTGPIDGTVTVLHIKTGKSRSYKTGFGTAWTVDFADDLAANVF